MEIGGDEPPIGNPEHYDSDVGAQAKPSTTGAKYGTGFTLAEILITLSIIGVVAALTIPSLIAKNREKERIVQLKKAYNVFSSAFSLAVIDYGNPSLWDWGRHNDGQSAIIPLQILTKYMNISRLCGISKGCYPKGIVYKYMDGTSTGNIDESTNGAKALLNDGMSITVWTNGSGCSQYGQTCGSIGTDINGAKGPNQFGKDVFEFWITQKGLIPFGLKDDGAFPLKSACVGGDGRGCTAWALIKENMDYPSQGTDWDE